MDHRKELPLVACKDFEQDLVLYYYGECVETERNRVETHIDGCAPCRHFLKELRTLLPLTAKPDKPPQAFWEGYSREMRRKLAAVGPKGPWWRGFFSFLRPWPVPALAAALVLVLALTFTFTKGMWRSEEQLSEEEAVLEILPMAENLEFFKTMDLIESMELIEALEGTGPGNGAV